MRSHLRERFAALHARIDEIIVCAVAQSVFGRFQ